MEMHPEGEKLRRYQMSHSNGSNLACESYCSANEVRALHAK